MPSKSLVQIVGALSFEKKLLGIGSILLVLSLFLPWYQDLDAFKTGDMFLGITGPLYLAGYSLLIVGAANLAFLFLEMQSKKIPFLNIKYSSFFFAAGLFTFFMLAIVTSVYFHPKFGINITLKQSQFGLFFSFIAASCMTIGGYLTTRDRATLLQEFEKEARDPFIEMPKQEKPKESLRNNPPSEPAAQPIPVNEKASENLIPEQKPKEVSKEPAQTYRMDL